METVEPPPPPEWGERGNVNPPPPQKWAERTQTQEEIWEILHLDCKSDLLTAK